jgi:hypothetical protein
LGLTSKKNLVKCTYKKIVVCCVQETELQKDLKEQLLTFPDFSLEVEQNDVKRRVGIYIKSSVKYRRRDDLEGQSNHLVVIDILQN